MERMLLEVSLNPFVSQVNYYLVEIERGEPRTTSRLNPFVSQVNYYSNAMRTIIRKCEESQSLRKSGQLLPAELIAELRLRAGVVSIPS